MSMASSKVVENLFVPQGQIDQLAYELGKTEDEALADILKSASSLITKYSSGGDRRKLFWSNVELTALNALLFNRCLRRKDAETAASDVERFEKLFEVFGERLKQLINERKYSQFQGAVQKYYEDAAQQQSVSALLWALEKCKAWRDSKSVVLQGDDETALFAVFTAVCSSIAPDMQSNISKRLEYTIAEISKLTPTPLPPPKEEQQQHKEAKEEKKA
jgi:hypothetical protein